jgi:hypothetical protein
MVLEINDEKDAHGIDGQNDYDKAIVPFTSKGVSQGGERREGQRCLIRNIYLRNSGYYRICARKNTCLSFIIQQNLNIFGHKTH